MNKKNLSIILSVFIAAFVISILGYIQVAQSLERYDYIRMSNPDDISIYKLVNKDRVEDLRKIDNVKKVGLKTEIKAIKLKNTTLRFNKFNSDYFNMQYKFLKSGDFPKNSKEIILSQKIGKDLNLKIGDRVNIEFGDRYLKGDIVNPDRNYNTNEKFNKDFSKEYKIVGFTRTDNSFGIQDVFSLIDESDKEFYPSIKVDKLSKTYETKEQIKKFFGEESRGSLVVENTSLLLFFHILEEGTYSLEFLLGKLIVPIIFVMIFVFMVKNIFNVWSIYKIKELSMYKSIGATNFQIYKILLKEALKISVIPLILGEIAGFGIMKLIFDKIFSMRALVYDIESVKFSINWQVILGISIILLIIIVISISFPARTISKIDIISGLKENISLKNYKKKRANKLFKELKINNRKILRPVFIIMISGLVIVESLICIKAIDEYNKERVRIDRDFNFKIRYSSIDNAYPEIFNKIKEKFKPEKSLISIEKRFYVDYSKLKFSKEFKKIGFNEAYKDFYYYPDSNLVDGILIGIDDNYFAKISKNKEDVVLVNLVQKNIKDFYKDAAFIPYLDSKTKGLDIKYLEDFNKQRIRIDKSIDKLVEDQNVLDFYTVELVTSLDNFRKLMDKGKREFKKRGMEFPKVYYNLEMKFKEEDIGKISSEAKEIMENNIKANENYNIRNIVLDKKAEKIGDRGILFLGLLSFLAVIFLNIANAYSSTNLSFFNRKKEIGILLSNGMDKKDLEKILIKENRKSIFLSVIISIIITSLIMAYLISFGKYVDFYKYIKFVRFEYIILSLLIISISSHLIYLSAMKKITRENIIDLLNSF